MITNQQTNKDFSQVKPQTFNQPRPLTEEKVKELIMDTLIELDLVPKPQKRKILNV